jgi:flagellar biosynthesis/type III secretory pathway protein FliH
MSLLPNIIKASQYTESKCQTARLRELTSGQEQAGSASPAFSKEISAAEKQQTILQDALAQARSIMENARSYTMNQMREATAKMNEEAARVKIAGHQEGFEQGAAEGRKLGEQEGREQGYRQGLQEGKRQAEQEQQEKSRCQKEEFTHLIEDLEQSKQRILEQFRTGIETLSLQIARKILQQEVDGGIAIPTIVSGVLESYQNQEWANIQLSPKMAELLQSDEQLMKRLQSVSKNLRILPKEEMSDSDCVIDLPDRQLDAGVQTQLKEIAFELHL